MNRIALFLVGCTVVLMVFAFVWPLVAPAYAQLQVFCIKPFVNVELRVDALGISVYQNEKLLTHREFLSFGGLGLTLALWLMTPGFSWKRRLLWVALGLIILFFLHVLGLWGLIAFAQAVAAQRAAGLMALLYSVIAVGDWIVPFLLWGVVLLRDYLRGSGATP
jgi:quinol-cytochrome oxidoreductase complex cytochrome b subunit